MQFLNLNGVAFVPWPVRDKHEGFCVGRVNFSTTRNLIKADILCVGDIRGVFKKFAAHPRRKMNFTTKRGVRDVTLLKRPLTKPLANRSCCIAKAAGCCKNVFFCRTQQRPAGSSDLIHGVTEKCGKGYPWRLVGNTGGILSSHRSGKVRIELFKAGRQNIEDDLHSGRPPSAVSEESVKEVVHLVMNELQYRYKTAQQKCRYMIHPLKPFSFSISTCSVCSWRRMFKCQIQSKGKFARGRLVLFWTSPEDLHTRFSTQDETQVSHLVPEIKDESHQWNRPAPRSPKKKICEVSRQGDGDSVLAHWKTYARQLPGLWH